MNKFESNLKLKRIKTKISHLIFIALCFIGCLYHVIKVTEVYLSFQTKIDVSFDTESQIVVPLVSFCKSKFALMINESRRNYAASIKTPSTPAAIYNSTFGFKDVFLFCRYRDRNGYYNYSHHCQLDGGFQIEKTVNHLFVCYNFKHPQFNHKDRLKGMLYEFWIYHHHQSEYILYLSSDNNVPNGESTNSLKLISNYF